MDAVFQASEDRDSWYSLSTSLLHDMKKGLHLTMPRFLLRSSGVVQWPHPLLSRHGKKKAKVNPGQAWAVIFHGKGNGAHPVHHSSASVSPVDSVAGRLEWEEAGKMVTLKDREV